MDHLQWDKTSHKFNDIYWHVKHFVRTDCTPGAQHRGPLKDSPAGAGADDRRGCHEASVGTMSSASRLMTPARRRYTSRFPCLGDNVTDAARAVYVQTFTKSKYRRWMWEASAVGYKIQNHFRLHIRQFWNKSHSTRSRLMMVLSSYVKFHY